MHFKRVLSILLLLCIQTNIAIGCFPRDCYYVNSPSHVNTDEPEQGHCQQCYSRLECKNPTYVACTQRSAELTAQQFLGQIPYLVVEGNISSTLRCIAYLNETEGIPSRDIELRGCFYNESAFGDIAMWIPTDSKVYCVLCKDEFCNAHGAFELYTHSLVHSNVRSAFDLIDTRKRRYFERPGKDGKRKRRKGIDETGQIEIPGVYEIEEAYSCLDWFSNTRNKP